jgi:serine/threonine protein kinase/DNA-binding SARP family transcriptional activator
MEERKAYLFGFPRLEQNALPIPVNRRKMLALLAYLAITAQPHSREALATLFWPDFDTSSALANLRRDLSRLKEILGEEVLQIEREKIQVNPGGKLWVDVLQFEDRVQQAQSHGHFRCIGEKSPICGECQAYLEEAAALYSDDFMAGFNLPDSSAFDDWQFFQREKLRGLLADVLACLTQSYINQGIFEKAVGPARRWLTIDPLHEPAQRMLMRLYAWTGQPSAALRQYKILTDLLEEDLGAKPEAETTALYEAIRSRRLTPPVVQTKGSPAINQRQMTFAERFHTESLLSTGGFGEIYLGHDQLTGKEVAIKRLLPQLIASRPEAIERFIREGQALEQLSHPNIVPMLAFYEHENSYNLVMEYLPGGTLRDLLERERSLEVDRALEIALELADALSRAHHLHILHRDLKPENILLDSGGHPRLIDFGLALLQGSDTRLTQAGALLGSPVYMSPEALQGQDLDQRSDVWSFGILLFEMLAGQPPFDGKQLTALMQQILHEPAPSIRQFCPDIPPVLENLISRMLEKDRDLRLPGMRQAAAELEAIRSGRNFITPAMTPNQKDSDKITPPDLFYINNLPPQPTSLFGRQKELAQLYEMLKNPDVRMVTLIGTGGIGKTRLAVEVASKRARDLPNGVVFVPLASVSGPEFILPAIANALHFRFSPGVDLKEQIINRLAGLKILLVLDNFEHLSETAVLISELLTAVPTLQVLVTSRERLNLVEEWVYEVAGLPYPPPGEPIPGGAGSWLNNYSAVQLFIDRARRADPKLPEDESTLAEIIRICQLVEGMPLALELAAPWVRSMTCAEISQELSRGLDILTASMRNLPDRHRSMRVVFEQSWQSLTPVEQEILARLSVFHNGCTREAAEKVTGARPLVFMTLVDKALLRHRSNRYEMHELVRQYAAERLAENNRLQEETLDRHHRYYLGLLERANTGLKGGRQFEAATEITTDIDNIHAAWKRAVQQNDRKSLAGAAEPFWLYSEFRGTLAQGAAIFRHALEAVQTPDDDPSLVGFLNAAEGSLLARQWHFDQGQELMSRGLEMLRKAEPFDPEKTAFALSWLAFLRVMLGQYPEAVQAARESLEHYAQTGDRWTQAGALRLLGAAALYQGQLRRAEEYLHQCVAVCKSIGELRIRSYAASNLGVIHLWYGQIEQARQYFEDSLRVSKACNDRLSRADALCERVRFFIASGEYNLAEETARKCIQVYRDLGRTKISLANIMLGKSLRLQGKEGAEEALQEGLASARAVNHRPDIASGLEGLGSLAIDRNEYDLADRYYNEALEIWTEIGNEPEIATLLCRIARRRIISGSQERDGTREKLVRALQLARKHQATSVANTAIAGLAILQLRDGEPQLAVPVLYSILQDPATPAEVRGRIERVCNELPPTLRQIGSNLQPANLADFLERWERQALQS